MAARKNKRKSPDQVEFELHWEMNCLNLLNDIVNHTLRPTAYTFVTSYPKPREVFASDFATRILHHYLDIRLRPLLEARMSNHTYNNRVGKGQNACQNAVIQDIYDASRGFTTDAWIVKVDLSGCFPNVSQDIAYKQLEEVVLADYHREDKSELIYILQVCVFSYPTEHCYRKSSLSKWKDIPAEKSLFTKPRGTGAAIGHLIWQNAVNYYFTAIDRWIESMGLRYERYVDDMYFVISNKESFLSAVLPELRMKLAEIGAKVNEKKHYCQHYTKGVECLGVHIKMDRIYLNNRVVNRGMKRAREFNHCIRPNKIDAMLASINSYLGMCKNCNGYSQAMKIIRELDGRWFEYVGFDRKRICLVAKEEYRVNNRIIKQFNFKRYDKFRKRRVKNQVQQRDAETKRHHCGKRPPCVEVHETGTELQG